MRMIEWRDEKGGSAFARNENDDERWLDIKREINSTLPIEGITSKRQI